MSLYPGAIDSFSTVANGDTVDPTLPNDQSSGIVATQSTLGTNPQGIFATVVARLNSLISTASVQLSSAIYAEDTGTSTALAVALTPTPPVYTEGQVVIFKAANTCGDSPTLSVNGQPAVALVKNAAEAVQAGDIPAGSIQVAVFDGTNFQVITIFQGSERSSSNQLCEFRATLTTGTPIADDSGAAGSTLYFTPFPANTSGRIALYDTTLGWIVLTTIELSIDMSTLADGVYDVFCYNNAGTPTLEFGPIWTTVNARATDLAVQDGINVKSGDPTRRYVATFYVTGGTVFDTYLVRFLYNAQNRIPRLLQASDDTFSTNSDVWNGILFPPYVQGLAIESIIASGVALGEGDGVSAAAEITLGFVSIGVDPYASVSAIVGTSALTTTTCRYPPAIGLDNLVLYFRSSVDTVTVNLLDDGASTPLTQITATVWL